MQFTFYWEFIHLFKECYLLSIFVTASVQQILVDMKSTKYPERFVKVEGFGPILCYRFDIIATQRAKRAGWHTKPIQACECHIRTQKYPLRTQGPPV